MQPLFSIIVPVYKTESRIGQCIRSVLLQTEKRLELILIDDGSPDRSGQICDQFAADDNRIIVIHQKNKGVSAARNVGLDRAKGEFIVFLDSDDLLRDTTLEMFLQAKADLIVGGVKELDDYGNELKCYQSENETYDLSLEKNVARYYTEWYMGQVWNKCFKRELIEKASIRFDENLNFGEDNLFSMEYVKHAQSIQVLSDIVYYWCRTAVSFLSDPGEEWVRKNNYLHERLYACFCDMPLVKDKIILKYVWALGERINSICLSDMCIRNKVRSVNELITAPFTQICVNSRTIGSTNPIMKLAIQKHLGLLVYLLSMRNIKRKRKI